MLVEKFEKSTKMCWIKYNSIKYNKRNLIILILESQLRDRDLKIEELNQTIHQISQNKVNPTVFI